MSVVVVGLDRPQTSLDLLERVAVSENALAKTLAEIMARAPVSEVVVVSTCLRTEIYAVVERFHLGVERLQEYLADKAGVQVDDLLSHLTIYFDDDVVTHLFSLASGLESAVVGETEVLGQVRRAVQVAEAERAAGPVLSAMFRRAVQVGRRVRTDTAIARGSTSLAHVAVELAAERLGGSFGGRRVVVVGAGDMGEGLVNALQGRQASDVVVVNRTRSRAHGLAERVGATAAGIDELGPALAQADVVLVSTGAALPVLDAELLAPPGAQRAAAGRAAVVVVDLAVPRNVDPGVRTLAGVELFDIDDLTAHAERALQSRRDELGAARAIVDAEVERWHADGRARGAAPLVSALRARVEQLRDDELMRHRSRFADLDDAQWAEVEAVVRDITAKLLHQPTVALKDAAGTPRGERLTEALRTLFDL
ncbi:MAG: glutamyl-tRNA reductase [Acidimicrobiales bacterium]